MSDTTRDYLSSCAGKEAFDTPALAWKIHLRRKMQNTKVYRCNFCGKWHLGRPSGPRSKGRKT